MYNLLEKTKLIKINYHPPTVTNNQPVLELMLDNEDKDTISIYPMGLSLLNIIENKIDYEMEFNELIVILNQILCQDRNMLSSFYIVKIDNIINVFLKGYFLEELCKNTYNDINNLNTIITCNLCNTIILFIIKYFNRSAFIENYSVNNNGIEFRLKLVNKKGE